VLTYVAYGLGIRSELPLPQLGTTEERPDVFVRLGKGNRQTKATDSSKCALWQVGAEINLAWTTVGRFRIRAGREIIIEPHAGVEQDILRTLLLGPALAALLHQRGALILHGSAVALGGSAIGFLGQSGAGKSTTAATLHARGHPVVADDAIAIRFVAGAPLVSPAYPQINLWPDSAASLAQDVSEFPRLYSRVEKRAISVSAGVSRDPLPLHVLYILGSGPQFAIERLRPQEALVELLRYSYGARLVHGNAMRLHFEQCTNLVRTTSIRHLTVRRALSELHLLAQLVERDAFGNAA